MKKIKSSQVAKFLGAELYGKDILIERPALIDSIEKNTVSFLRDKEFSPVLLKKINEVGLCLVICPPGFKNQINASVIVAENPYYEFSQAVKKFFNKPDVKVIKGKNCRIKKGAVIGGDGFNYQKNRNGKNELVTHIGGVKIGDNVDVGSCTVIDRGIIGDTVIHSDVKIDNLVHIAHDCQIGNGTLIAAGVILGGKVIIGKNCFIGLNATIRQKIKIGDGALVGMGAVVVNDVPPGVTVVGNPARPLIKNTDANIKR